MNSLGKILIHARFQRKTNQNCISFDFDNDLFTFDVISVINKLRHQSLSTVPGYFTGKINLGLIGVCKKRNPSVVFSGERKISTLGSIVLVGKLGEPRFPLQRMDPRVEIFLSPLTTHDGFYLSYTHTHTHTHTHTQYVDQENQDIFSCKHENTLKTRSKIFFLQT